MLDDQGEQIFRDDRCAGRAGPQGWGTTLRSVGHRPDPAPARQRRRLRHAQDMLAELADDNRSLTGFLRAAHGVCETHGDVASTS